MPFLWERHFHSYSVRPSYSTLIITIFYEQASMAFFFSSIGIFFNHLLCRLGISLFGVVCSRKEGRQIRPKSLKQGPGSLFPAGTFWCCTYQQVQMQRKCECWCILDLNLSEIYETAHYLHCLGVDYNLCTEIKKMANTCIKYQYHQGVSN